MPAEPRFTVVELAGLPGAGKTAICRAVRAPYEGKGSVPLTRLRPRPAELKAAKEVLALCASTRPFSWRRMVRGLNLVVFLRHYIANERPILLDQGVVQKLWSILLDAEGYSRTRLDKAMTSLKPFAPRHVVWIETPFDVVVERLAQRNHDDGRFDTLAREVAEERLRPKIELLKEIAALFEQTTGVSLVKLDGREPAQANARKLDELLCRPGGIRGT